MKKLDNKGFIATSLIYSFFLVFLALLLAILSTYITTNRVLSSYNKSIKNQLDNKSYIPEIYALGNECYVQYGNNDDILTKCFKTYNMVEEPKQGDDYICTYTNNPNMAIYNTSGLSISPNPYQITCKVRNKLIDERYNEASTNMYVVNTINPNATGS